MARSCALTATLAERTHGRNLSATLEEAHVMQQMIKRHKFMRCVRTALLFLRIAAN